ncbi:MAG: amidohydrolase family protein [Bryobacteraceae bacterium]
MKTPWGEIEIADAHVHFFSHRFFTLLAGQKNATVGEIMPVLGWETPPAEPEALAARWAAELDRHGVARASLIASLPGDEESVAAAVARYPDRFFGCFMVNPAAAGAVERVRRALAGGRLACVCLFPAMHRYSMHDERVTAILEEAAARPGTAVFVHCGVLTVGVRAKLGLPSLFDMRYSNPLELHAVALRYPQVSFIVPHFGAGYFREALMLCDLCGNVYLDTSSGNSWVKYQQEGCDLRSVFRRALGAAGPRRLLFGTDSSFFPRGWQPAILQEQMSVLEALGVREEDARAILGENLTRLFPQGKQ